ncbi:MAG: universal stress protein [Chloroflexi bacterium]|nr:universal stress protein [Chloroflexota bacterium]
MFKRILVPLDGSELAERALPLAQSIAQSSNATIHLVQVVSRLPEAEAGRSGDSILAAELERDAARQLVEGRITRGKEYVGSVAAQLENAGIEVTTAMLEGGAAENIVNYTREHGIDLVVMSTHGFGGLKRFFLGSVTDRVIRSCEVPVLVVPCS